MGTIAEKLNRLKQTKNEIKQAIINKGIIVGDVFNEYASAIDSIKIGDSLNIHYGLEAPEDTNKLWIKTETKPSKLNIVTKAPNYIVGYNPGIASITNDFAQAYATVGNDIYIIGGYYNGLSIYKFDTTTNRLTLLSTTLPQILRYATAQAVGSNIYIFGGQSGSNSSNTVNTIYKFNTITNTITTLSSTIPYPTQRQSSAKVGTDIYLFGGQEYYNDTLSRIKTIYKYNTTTNSITRLSVSLPVVCYNVGCAVVGTDIYLFGGNGTNQLTSINKFNTLTNTITTLSSTLSSGLSGIACETVGTDIYLFGGYGGIVSGSSVYSDQISKFNTITNELTTLDIKLTQSTYNINIGIVGSTIYLIGGTEKTTIDSFSLSFKLTKNNLLLIQDLSKTPFKLINSEENEVECAISEAYIGNSNNDSEYVEFSVYKDGVWI